MSATNLGPILALFSIGLVVVLFMRKYNPIAVLLLVGMAMLLFADLLANPMPKLKAPSGSIGFDILGYIVESFADIGAGVGLVIMIISGFVAYMDKIGASDALVALALRPLHYFKKNPAMLAMLILPLGQLLFISITSAAGLGLLLMATVAPVLRTLAVSRTTTVSLITATTAFGIGPASAIALSAAHILEMPITTFFTAYQLPLTLATAGALLVAYYFVNKYQDTQAGPDQELLAEQQQTAQAKNAAKAPLAYGLIPLLPLALLLASGQIGLKLDTNIAMLAGLFVAMAAEFIRKKSAGAVLQSLQIFWDGMGDIFKTVVTLIVAADLFAKGLIALGFIDSLLAVSQQVGLGGVGVGIVMTVLVFFASVMMGSGNAAFFAFGPLVPAIAGNLSIASVEIILPMTLAASMGRTVSPIAGVVVAAAKLGHITPLQVARRNLVPFLIALVVMIVFNFLY